MALRFIVLTRKYVCVFVIVRKKFVITTILENLKEGKLNGENTTVVSFVQKNKTLKYIIGVIFLEILNKIYCYNTFDYFFIKLLNVTIYLNLEF